VIVVIVVGSFVSSSGSPGVADRHPRPPPPLEHLGAAPLSAYPTQQLLSHHISCSRSSPAPLAYLASAEPALQATILHLPGTVIVSLLFSSLKVGF
jgi:hypothetical protein